MVRKLPLLALALAACARSEPEAPPPRAAVDAAAPAARLVLRRRKCMGTACELKALHPDEQAVDAAFARAMEEVDRLEGLMTSWRDSSEVSAINAAAGKSAVTVSPDTLKVIERAQEIARLTDGAFDITVGVFKGLWKFDEDNDGTLPDRREVERRRKLVDHRDVVVDGRSVRLRRPGQRINLEGIAKGYAVDAAVRVLRAAGVRDFIFKAGGDLFASGRKGERQWRVGVQDPRAPHGRVIFELALEDQAFNTAGDYERFVLKDGVRYHHILDARTGFPATKTRAVTVLAPDAFTADALDTALFAAGPESSLKVLAGMPQVQAVIVDAQNRVHVTPGLTGRIVKRGDPTDGP